MIDWGYPLAGLVVGFAVGLTGVGGGALMTPILHIGFGIPVTTAVGTDLLYAALTKSYGAVVHARSGSIRWDVVLRLAAGSIPAAMATILALHVVEIDEAALGATIKSGLSAALLVTALILVFRRRLTLRLRQMEAIGRLRAAHRRHRGTITVLAGGVIGFLVTLTSVGAGVIGTTAVLLLYPGLATVGVVGTELAHAVPLTLAAGLGHLSLGTVDLSLLASLLLGSLPGVYAGGRLGSRVPDDLLRPVLAGMLLLIGVRLVMSPA